jgi:hypothetical protein
MSMRRDVCRTAAAAVFVVVMAACSGNGDQSSAGESTPPGSMTSATGVPTPPTAGPTEGAPPGAQVLGTARVGESFAVTVLTSSTTADPDRWQFTVRSVTCGKPLDRAVMVFAAESVGSPTATPAPETGKQFCVLTMDAVNVGKSMAVWNADSTVSLNVQDTRYTQSQKDAAYALDYAQYWNSKGQTAPTFGLNPGSRGPVHGVFQIPNADKPTSIWVTSGTAIETIDGVQPGYLVRLQ